MNVAAHGQLVVVAALVAMASTGCSSTGDVRAPESAGTASERSMRIRHASASKAERELQRGVRSYEDAQYEAAARQLQSALDGGLRQPRDKAKAYKYLAFLACTSGRMKSCQTEFRNALAVDPKFDLAPAEAGHPIWGPVFREARLEVKGKPKTR